MESGSSSQVIWRKPFVGENPEVIYAGKPPTEKELVEQKWRPGSRTAIAVITLVASIGICGFAGGMTTNILNLIKTIEVSPAIGWSVAGFGAIAGCAGFALYRINYNLSVGKVTILTINGGTWRDKGTMIQWQNLMEKHHGFFMEAAKEFDPELEDYSMRSDFEKDDLVQPRLRAFKTLFSQHQTDLICLQEINIRNDEKYQGKRSYLTIDEIRSVLPKHFAFTFCKDPNFGETDCFVAWDARRFEFLGMPQKMDYSDVCRRDGPDTLVLLRDRLFNKEICVGSAHSVGFSLATVENEKNREVAKKQGQAGDQQLDYDLEKMASEPVRGRADLFIYAGDFNATWVDYPERLEKMENAGFVTDKKDQKATILDASLKLRDGITPKAVRLDYVWTKGKKLIKIVSQTIGSVYHFYGRPSDHLAVKAVIYFKT